jgi:hypothetical protein
VGDFQTHEFLFDNQALSKLDEVVASCHDSLSFYGIFTTQSGNPTTVEIALIPTLDNSEQKWTVVSINRDFHDVASSNQRDEVQAQLDARYSAFDFKRRPLGRALKDGDAQYSGSIYGFKLTTLWPTLRERLTQHPLCSSKKVNID